MKVLKKIKSQYHTFLEDIEEKQVYNAVRMFNNQLKSRKNIENISNFLAKVALEVLKERNLPIATTYHNGFIEEFGQLKSEDVDVVYVEKNMVLILSYLNKQIRLNGLNNLSISFTDEDVIFKISHTPMYNHQYFYLFISLTEYEINLEQYLARFKNV